MFKRNDLVPFTKKELAQWDSIDMDISAEEGNDARVDVKRAFLADLVEARFRLQKAKEQHDLIRGATNKKSFK